MMRTACDNKTKNNMHSLRQHVATCYVIDYTADIVNETSTCTSLINSPCGIPVNHHLGLGVRGQKLGLRSNIRSRSTRSPPHPLISVGRISIQGGWEEGDEGSGRKEMREGGGRG